MKTFEENIVNIEENKEDDFCRVKIDADRIRNKVIEKSSFFSMFDVSNIKNHNNLMFYIKPSVMDRNKRLEALYDYSGRFAMDLDIVSMYGDKDTNQPNDNPMTRLLRTTNGINIQLDNEHVIDIGGRYFNRNKIEYVENYLTFSADIKKEDYILIINDEMLDYYFDELGIVCSFDKLKLNGFNVCVYPLIDEGESDCFWMVNKNKINIELYIHDTVLYSIKHCCYKIFASFNINVDLGFCVKMKNVRYENE